MPDNFENFIQSTQEDSEQVKIDGNDILISICSGEPYLIALARCDTHDKILSWVQQLTEKTWMTLPALNRFIQIAQSHYGLDRAGL